MATKFGASFATKQDQTKTWSTIWIFLRLTGATSGCFPGPGIWLSSWPLSVITEYSEPSWPCLVTNWRPGNNHFDLVTMKSGSTKHTIIGLNYLDLPGTVYIPYIMHGSVATRVVLYFWSPHYRHNTDRVFSLYYCLFRTPINRLCGFLYRWIMVFKCQSA